MKTKAKMPKRTQHCDTENGKHCDTFFELGFNLSEKPPLMLLARYLGTCHTASGTVTRPKKKTLTRIVGSTVTDSCVTVLILKMTDEYYGLLMNKKIDAVWLTIERMAELKGCSNRTVWRYIEKHKMHTVKRQVKIGSAKVLKTFVLPDPETLELEFSDTYKQRQIPEFYLETVIPIGERMIKSMLVYGYQNTEDRHG
jgi:predicted DNA-binding transcriptional regulator AlpA